MNIIKRLFMSKKDKIDEINRLRTILNQKNYIIRKMEFDAEIKTKTENLKDLHNSIIASYTFDYDELMSIFHEEYTTGQSQILTDIYEENVGER